MSFQIIISLTGVVALLVEADADRLVSGPLAVDALSLNASLQGVLADIHAARHL